MMLVILIILLIISLLTFQYISAIIIIIIIILIIRNKYKKRNNERIISIIDPEFSNYDHIENYNLSDQINAIIRNKYYKLHNGICEDIGIFKLNELKKMYKNKDIVKFKELFKNILIEHTLSEHAFIKSNIDKYRSKDIKYLAKCCYGIPINIIRKTIEPDVVLKELRNYYDLNLGDEIILRLMKNIINKKSDDIDKQIKQYIFNKDIMDYYSFYVIMRLFYK